MRLLRILPFLLFAALAASGLAAAARPSDAVALAEAKRQAEQALIRYRALARQAEQATSEAARARAEAEALAARIQAAEADLTAAEARIRIVERLQAEQRARLAERQQPVVRLTAALQTMARRPPALALVQPGSVEDVVHVRSLLASTLPVIRDRTASLRAEVERGNLLRRHADSARRALVDSRASLSARRVALARFEARQRRRSESLAELAVTESDRALALGEEARELSRLLGTREYRQRLSATLQQLPGPLPRPGPGREATRPPGAPEPDKPDYLLPVQGKLVRGVGEISDAGVHARGLTFEVADGAEVVSPARGRVVYARPFRGYRHVVIIDHGRGWSTVVTDLASTGVRAGQVVARGTLLGAAGSDDPRVSVELRRNGQPVPIAPLLAN